MYSSLCIDYRSAHRNSDFAARAKFRAKFNAKFISLALIHIFNKYEFPYIQYIWKQGINCSIPSILALNLALNLAVRIKKTCVILVAQEVVPRY